MDLTKELLKAVKLLYYGNCPHFMHWEQCRKCLKHIERLISRANKEAK